MGERNKDDFLAQIMAGLTAGLPLTQDELQHISNLSIAIGHAISIAEKTPSTLTGRASVLVIDKLREAEHWMFEVVNEGCQR